LNGVDIFAVLGFIMPYRRAWTLALLIFWVLAPSKDKVHQ